MKRLLFLLNFIFIVCYSAEESKDEQLEKLMERCQAKISQEMAFLNQFEPDGVIVTEQDKEELKKQLGEFQDKTNVAVNQTKRVLLLRKILKVQASELQQLPLILIIIDAICMNLPEGSNELDVFLQEAQKLAPISNKAELKEYLIKTNANLNKLMIWLISTVNKQQALNFKPNRFFESLFTAIQESKDIEGVENYKGFITKPNDLESIFRLMIIIDEKGNNMNDLDFIYAFVKNPNNNDPTYQDNLIKAFIQKCKQHQFAGKYLFNSMLKASLAFKEIKPELVNLGLI